MSFSPTIAAGIFVVLSVVAIAFQVALLFGAPWGHLTLGGKYTGALPPRVRPVAAISAALLGAFALIVLARARLAFHELHDVARTAVWFPIAYLVLGSILNTITPSKAERRLWLPIILLLLVSSLVVALLAP